jgi:hypothetical protein
MVRLSKSARVVELFARATQVQERPTTQIANWLQEQLDPKGLGVALKAQHLCTPLRGVQTVGPTTVTSSLHGVVRDDARARGFWRSSGGTTDTNEHRVFSISTIRADATSPRRNPRSEGRKSAADRDAKKRAGHNDRATEKNVTQPETTTTHDDVSERQMEIVLAGRLLRRRDAHGSRSR